MPSHLGRIEPRVLWLRGIAALVIAACLVAAATSSVAAQFGQLRVSTGGPYFGATGQPVTVSAFVDIGGLPPGTQVQVQWTFGDGGTGFGQTTQHVYASPGTYTITVVAFGAGQTASNTTIAQIVQGSQTGQLTVSAGGPYGGPVGLPITFSAVVGLGGRPPGTPVQVTWQFGDGGTGFGQTTTHIYTLAGTYTVTVTATIGLGQAATASTTAVIGGGSQAFQVNPGGPYSGAVGQPISFSGTVSGAPFGATVQYSWSFGDGGTGIGQVTSHAYTQAGTYTVTLTVTSSAGGQGSASTTATIGGSAQSTEQIQLFSGCNNVSATWPNGTPVATMAAAVTPIGGLLAIWRFDNVGQRFIAYSPLPNAPNDLTVVNRAEPVFVCMNTAGTLTRPVI